MVVLSRSVTTFPSIYSTVTRPPDPGGGQDTRCSRVDAVKMLSVEDYFVQYADVRKNTQQKANDNGNNLVAVAELTIFLAQHDIFEPVQQDCEDHKHWYNLMECYNFLWYERYTVIKALHSIHKVSIEKVRAICTQMRKKQEIVNDNTNNPESPRNVTATIVQSMWRGAHCRLKVFVRRKSMVRCRR